jgi:hypothetical protein
MTLSRATSAVVGTLLLLAGCASGGRPTPDAIYRHSVTGDVQWCSKPGGVAMALGGAIVVAEQDYAGCKTNWEAKGYTRLGSGATLSEEDQRRYGAERERMNKALADSIRKN